MELESGEYFSSNYLHDLEFRDIQNCGKRWKRKNLFMQEIAEKFERRTATDIVFNELYEDITSLNILPGAKLSESEIAKRFGISRQPVRDAFNRLENLDLLLIRPQRATEVRGFSMELIGHARFVRLAVELEVIRHACSIWDNTKAQQLDENLQMQKQCLADGQADRFHSLDYDFHKLICELGGCSLAFKTIEESKQKVDRLCVLSLDRKDEFAILLDDHIRIAEALKNGTPDQAVDVARLHLGRLDATIEQIYTNHMDYFE